MEYSDIIRALGKDPINYQVARCEILLWCLLRWHSGDGYTIQLAESMIDSGLLTPPEKTTPPS